MQCLDQLHNLLRQLATRPFPSRIHTDDQGVARLVTPTTSWEDFVHLACDEIRHWGSSSLQVHQRMRRLLADLLTVTTGLRRQVLEEQLGLLEARLDQDLPPAEHPVVKPAVSQGGPWLSSLRVPPRPRVDGATEADGE